MTLEIFFVILMMGIGTLFVLLGIWFYRKKEVPMEVSNIIQIEKQLDAKTQEAKEMVGDLNDFASYLMKEIENKHKELILLYQLIDEKEKQVYQRIVKETKEKHLSQEQKQVLEMYKEGKTIDEIARELQLGKGEVQLMIGLFQMR